MFCNEYIKSLFDNSRGDFTSQVESAGTTKEEAFEQIFCDNLSSTRFFHIGSRNAARLCETMKNTLATAAVWKKGELPDKYSLFTWAFPFSSPADWEAFFVSLFKHSICNWRVLTGCQVWKEETHMNSQKNSWSNWNILCSAWIHTCCVGDSLRPIQI